MHNCRIIPSGRHVGPKRQPLQPIDGIEHLEIPRRIEIALSAHGNLGVSRIGDLIVAGNDVVNRSLKNLVATGRVQRTPMSEKKNAFTYALITSTQ